MMSSGQPSGVQRLVCCGKFGGCVSQEGQLLFSLLCCLCRRHVVTRLQVRVESPEHVISEICSLKLRSSDAAIVTVTCHPRHRPLTGAKFSPEKHNLCLLPEITSARRAALPLVAAVLVASGVCIIKTRLYSVRSWLVR